MSTPRPSLDDAPTRESDSQQAAYFRRALADHRALVAAEVARHTRTLESLTTKSDAIAITRLRRDIRSAERQCRELDRMIEALDRRFARTWSARA